MGDLTYRFESQIMGLLSCNRLQLSSLQLQSKEIWIHHVLFPKNMSLNLNLKSKAYFCPQSKCFPLFHDFLCLPNVV